MDEFISCWHSVPQNQLLGTPLLKAATPHNIIQSDIHDILIILVSSRQIREGIQSGEGVELFILLLNGESKFGHSVSRYHTKANRQLMYHLDSIFTAEN